MSIYFSVGHNIYWDDLLGETPKLPSPNIIIQAVTYYCRYRETLDHGQKIYEIYEINLIYIYFYIHSIRIKQNLLLVRCRDMFPGSCDISTSMHREQGEE